MLSSPDVPSRLIDGFIFYNELDLLEYRLELLYDVVDLFILVEAECTFTRQHKPLFYAESGDRFSRYKDKIRHVVVAAAEMQSSDPWTNEATQRNAICRGLESQSGCLIVSDVDEIPSPACLAAVARPTSLSMDFYYYNLNSRMLTPWCYPKIAPLPLQVLPNELRQQQTIDVIENAGWHLSYFGDAAFIKNKIEQFSHQELNVAAFTDVEAIEARITATADLFDRADSRLVAVSVVDNKRLPPRYAELLSRHYAF